LGTLAKIHKYNPILIIFMVQINLKTQNIGPDGVLELFPSAANPKHGPLYLDLTKGDSTSKIGPFAITYGSNFISSKII
jgi:hypothetical protein